jgi:hypothetical protein
MTAAAGWTPIYSFRLGDARRGYDSRGNRIHQINRENMPIPAVSVDWTYDKADRPSLILWTHR